MRHDYRAISSIVALCMTTLASCLAPSISWAQNTGFQISDTQLRFDGASVSPDGATARAGFTSVAGTLGGIEPILVYRLPTLAANTIITNAEFSVNLASITTIGSINYNVDLYAFSYRPSNQDPIRASDFYVGPNDTTTGATLIQDNLVARANVTATTTNVRFNTNEAGSSALAVFLNAQYAAGATGGAFNGAAGDFIVFRLTPDTTAPSGRDGGGYNFSTQNNLSTSGLRPLLNLTTVALATPEPSSFALLGALPLALGGYVVRRRKAVKSAGN